MISAIVEVDYCACGVVWDEAHTGPLVRRIIIADDRRELIAIHGADVQCSDPPTAIAALCRSIACALNGRAAEFDLDVLDRGRCTEFQLRVLAATMRIPLGCVVTYGDIANEIGAPRAARAVGTALARNPFPVVFPCHRVIPSAGGIGGYTAGARIKSEMLRREGWLNTDDHIC